MSAPVPIPSPTVSVPGGPGITDYLTGWGTIALAAVTVLAIWVTVRTARTDRRRDDTRRQEDRDEAKSQAHARQLAQARLVIISGPEVSPPSPLEDNWNSYEVHFPFFNYGERPVIGIGAEVWVEGTPLDQPCSSEVKERYLLAQDRITLQVPIESQASELRLGGWRIRWTDADGGEWCIDEPQQSEPRRLRGADASAVLTEATRPTATNRVASRWRWHRRQGS